MKASIVGATRVTTGPYSLFAYAELTPLAGAFQGQPSVPGRSSCSSRYRSPRFDLYCDIASADMNGRLQRCESNHRPTDSPFGEPTSHHPRAGRAESYKRIPDPVKGARDGLPRQRNRCSRTRCPGIARCRLCAGGERTSEILQAQNRTLNVPMEVLFRGFEDPR